MNKKIVKSNFFWKKKKKITLKALNLKHQN
jgi:hypothetical protein